MPDEPLFSLPQEGPVEKWDLSEIEDGDLAAHAAGLRERVAEVLAGRADPEIVGDRTRTEVADQMQEAVLAIEKIDAEIAERAADETGYETKLDELASRAGVTAKADDEPVEADAEETEVEEVEEATVAAATTATNPVARAPRPLPAAKSHRPKQSDHDDGSGLRVTPFAAGLGAPYESMTQLDRRGVGEFMDDIIHKNRVQPGQKVVLAHARFDFPAERVLSEGPDGYLVNADRVRNIMGAQALTASGDLCAPLPPRYELPGVETAARPVRGALESFVAARGGVQIGVTPTMGDYTDAVGVVTAAENAQGGTFAVKGCMRIECPDFNPTKVDSIYQCIEADNLAAKSYPELMARIADLVMAEQARLADSKLLQAIKVGSTNVVGDASSGGAHFNLFGDIYKIAAGIRSRNRMPADATLQALFPAWTIDLLALDSTRRAYGDVMATRAGMESELRGAGIIPTFYLDGPSTGTGQIFAAQTAGAILTFPATLQWAIFPSGSWLHLDAGELNLGVVRDSSLNATNDFQIFAETWENVAFTGVESDWVSSAVCASGALSAPVDLHTEC
jgi:hypothetical protein